MRCPPGRHCPRVLSPAPLPEEGARPIRSTVARLDREHPRLVDREIGAGPRSPEPLREGRHLGYRHHPGTRSGQHHHVKAPRGSPVSRPLRQRRAMRSTRTSRAGSASRHSMPDFVFAAHEKGDTNHPAARWKRFFPLEGPAPPRRPSDRAGRWVDQVSWRALLTSGRSARPARAARRARSPGRWRRSLGPRAPAAPPPLASR